jgi:formamidopyrimidine-DNA glycosylase
VPELPEVEFVRRELRRAMEGARIDQVILRRADLRQPFAPDFAERLEGQQIRSVNRRAKYLLVELSSDDVLVMHLGMSGWFTINGGPPGDLAGGSDAGAFDKHDHVIFELSNGATVVFNDPRRFGFMKVLSPDELAADPALSVLGPEPLARGFSAEGLARTLCARKTPLKVALLDQTTVAGLGNIYACEALHVAGLSPRRRASTIATRKGEPRVQAVALAEAIRAVLKDAIANRHRAGGADRFRVYDHEGDSCPRSNCGGTIKRIVQAGRSTFYCPACQK